MKTFKHWGVVEASEEELGATLAEHIEQMRELEDFDAPKRLPQEYLDEWCDEEHRYYLLPGMGRSNRRYRSKIQLWSIIAGIIGSALIGTALWLLNR